MMDIAQELGQKLRKWDSITARKVEKLVIEIIELADKEALVCNHDRPLNEDPFLSDKVFYQGEVPPDSARNHDKYLYGDET